MVVVIWARFTGARCSVMIRSRYGGCANCTGGGGSATNTRELVAEDVRCGVGVVPAVDAVVRLEPVVDQRRRGRDGAAPRPGASRRRSVPAAGSRCERRRRVAGRRCRCGVPWRSIGHVLRRPWPATPASRRAGSATRAGPAADRCRRRRRSRTRPSRRRRRVRAACASWRSSARPNGCRRRRVAALRGRSAVVRARRLRGRAAPRRARASENRASR